VTGEGRQKDANTARRTSASRSETAAASRRDMMYASVPADHDDPETIDDDGELYPPPRPP